MDKITSVSKVELPTSEYVKPFRILFEQDGKKKIWDCIKIHDSVSILIHNVSRDVFILVKQFRPAVYINQAASRGETSSQVDTEKVPGDLGLVYELCAGIVDKNCSWNEIAQTEVLEECGYQVPLSSLEEVTTSRGGTGVTGTKQAFFYAKVTDDMRVSSGGGNVDEGEMIEVVEIPVAESLTFAMDQNIEKPVGLIFAFLWYHHYRAPKSIT